MSDETPDVPESTDGVDSSASAEETRPRPRPRPAAAAETDSPAESDTADTAESDTGESDTAEAGTAESDTADAVAAEPEPTEVEPADPEPSEPPAPMSAASRARRIGGAPVPPAEPPRLPSARHAAPAPEAKGSRFSLRKGDAAPKSPAPKSPAPQRLAPTVPSVPVPGPIPPEPGARSRQAAGLITTVLSALALALVVVIVIAAHGVYYGKSTVSASSRDNFQQTVLAAAKSCTATVNTYKYTDLDAAEKSALACATGGFKTDLATAYEKTLKPEAPAAKASQTAQVNDAGIESVTADHSQVVVLLYGQLSLTNSSTASSSPQIDPFGYVLTMQKVGSHWLIARAQADTGDSSGS